MKQQIQDVALMNDMVFEADRTLHHEEYYRGKAGFSTMMLPPAVFCGC